jgi:hypothetical protein
MNQAPHTPQDLEDDPSWSPAMRAYRRWAREEHLRQHHEHPPHRWYPQPVGMRIKLK